VPLLWAVLPPVAIAVVERVAFDSAHFAGALRDRFLGGPVGGGGDAGGLSMDMLAAHPLGHFLASPELWSGLAVTAVFLFGAARLRRAGSAI
jgi:ABC-2 type transport system permease protein